MTAECEQRTLSMCCQRCYSTKYDVFKREGTLQYTQLVSFAFSIQLCRLWSAHPFKDFDLIEQHLWQHIESPLCLSESQIAVVASVDVWQVSSM